MCTTCGCGHGDSRIEGLEHDHTHEGHSNDPSQGHHHANHHHDQGPEHAHAAGMSTTRMVQIEQDILASNNQYANTNRRWFTDRGILALNLLSGPGSGKTSILTRTLTELRPEIPISVIEGDQETSQDAERIRATGAKAVQINTGKGCHLDAHQVGHAVEHLSPDPASILMVENVGNLVCPAAFDLGESRKVTILSVTEGEDKPIKYPDMFHIADLLLINKIDLLPYLDFDIDNCLEMVRRVNPGVQVLQVSAKTGEGMADWYQWLKLEHQRCLIGYTPGVGGADG